MNTPHRKPWLQFTLGHVLVLTLGIALGFLPLRLWELGEPASPVVSVRLKILDVPRDELATLGLSMTSDNRSSSVLAGSELIRRIAKLEELKQAKVISNPTMMTLSGQSTYARIGSEIPYPTETTGGSIAIDWREVGTHVEILPTIKRNGRIDLKIETELSWVSEPPPTMSGSNEVPPPIERIASAGAFEVGSGATILFGGQTGTPNSSQSDRAVVFVATVEGPVRR
jgi:type II secretory pathway component GspD/PulD (secretin)